MSDKVTQLSTAYATLLAAMGIVPGDKGQLIQTCPNSPSKQVMVNGIPMVLPSVDNTRNPSDSLVVFHPLSENLLLGESPVIKELRALMMDYLHDMILTTVECLLKIAIDPETVKNLSPNQIELLRCTSGVDETTIKNWNSIIRRTESRGSTNRVITIFLKRGTELHGNDYKRAAIVNFNLYDELVEGKLNIYGVKIRKADAAIFTKVLETVVDGIGETDKYSVGSESMIAPYFDALVRAYAGVLKTINGPQWNFRKAIESIKGSSWHTKDDFSELFNDLGQYRDIIPPLPFNDGDRNERRASQAPTSVEQPQQPVVNGTPIPEAPVQPVVQQPKVPQQPPVQPQVPPYQQATQQPVQPQQSVQPQQPAQQHVSQQMGSITDQMYGYNYGYGQPQQPLNFWQQEEMIRQAQQQGMYYQQPAQMWQQPQQPVVNSNYGFWNQPGFVPYP